MNTFRVWLFRGLVITGGGLILLSWFMPWWSCYVQAYQDNMAEIHPWGLTIAGQAKMYLGSKAEMPGYFTPLMWTYLGLVLAILLVGAWFKDKNLTLFRKKLNISRWLVGIAGFSYVVVVILAFIVGSIRTGDIQNMKFIGSSYIRFGEGEESWVEGSLQLGYWLACATGPLLIALALLRNKIIGKAKSTTR